MLEMATKQRVTLETLNKNVLRLEKKLDHIERILDDEGELSDYAKRELEKARKRPLHTYISHEEVKRKLRLK